MSLLVFGATGQVAREIARRAPHARMLSRAEADLCDPEACANVITNLKPSAVINAAAWTAVDRAEEEEPAARIINADAPAAMARAATAVNAVFVHISTDYVFDGTGSAPRCPGDATAPANAYGRTKLAGEDGLRAAGGTYAILRTSWVFSAHGANFLKTMLRLSETRDALSVVDDQIGGPTPAGAIADACLRIADTLRTAPALSGTYHFSGAPDVSWKDFAQAIFDAAGRPVTVTGIPTADYPTPARRPLNSRMDCSSTKTAFGIDRPDWRAALPDILTELGVSPT